MRYAVRTILHHKDGRRQRCYVPATSLRDAAKLANAIAKCGERETEPVVRVQDYWIDAALVQGLIEDLQDVVKEQTERERAGEYE